MDMAAAQGLWQFEREEAVADDRGRQHNDAFTFAIQGNQLTLRLFTPHFGIWKSHDDFYQLQTRWQGTLLQYRPPFGDWAGLAFFEEGRFIDIGNGKRRLFKRIEPAEVVGFNRAILAPREAHDYRIQPDGSMRP